MTPFALLKTTGIFLPNWPMFALGMILFALFDAGIEPVRLFGRHTTVAAGAIVLIGVIAFMFLLLQVTEVGHLAAATNFAVLIFFFGKGVTRPFDN